MTQRERATAMILIITPKKVLRSRLEAGDARDDGRAMTIGHSNIRAPMPELEGLRAQASRGPDERKPYSDALEEMYSEQLKAGNATARRQLMDLSKSHGAWPSTPLAKEFFERLLPLLPKRDQELFLSDMLQEAKLTAHKRLEESWGWWRRLWQKI